jgi:hypothetical protein
VLETWLVMPVAGAALKVTTASARLVDGAAEGCVIARCRAQIVRHLVVSASPHPGDNRPKRLIHGFFATTFPFS